MGNLGIFLFQILLMSFVLLWLEDTDEKKDK